MTARNILCQNKEWLYQKYVIEGLESRAISIIAGCDVTVVFVWLKRHGIKARGKLIDLTGKKFGRWFVVQRSLFPTKSPRWLCKCDCGVVKDVLGTGLVSGKSTSCGCSKIKSYVKYGKETFIRICGIWRNMNWRCTNTKAINYKHYGGSGIRVCDEWGDVLTFVEWAINNGYKAGLELDRKDFTKGYSPSNCRWVTNLIQQNNKSNSVIITYNGRSQTLPQWAREIGVSPGTFRKRLRLNWPIDRILNEPINITRSSVLRG